MGPVAQLSLGFMLTNQNQIQVKGLADCFLAARQTSLASYQQPPVSGPEIVYLLPAVFKDGLFTPGFL